MRHAIYGTLLLILLVPVTALKARVLQSEPANVKYEDWLITNGQRQEFKIRVELFLPDGQPASDFEVQAQYQNQKQDTRLKIDGNRITANLSMIENGQFPELKVATYDGRFLKTVDFPTHDLRRWCAEGMKVTLTPARQITLRVVDPAGKPVANASVINQGTKTNAAGIAVLKVPADEVFRGWNVIAPDGSAGTLGVQDLSSEQAKANEFEIKTTAKGIRQTIKLVDADGNPVPDIQTIPNPMDRAVRKIPIKGYPMRTDSNGEVEIVWLTKLPGPRGKIRVYDSNWQAVDDVRTPKLWSVNLRRLPRKRVSGKVILPDGVKGGFAVQLVSSDHPTERRRDVVYGRTDENGGFTADVLPHVPYCVYVTDSQWSSTFWDGVLIEEDGTVNQPELTISPSLPVKIIATLGEGNAPMANTSIYVNSKHVFKSLTGRAIAGPSWNVTTDAKGVAHLLAGAGPLQASIYSPEFNDSKTIAVTEDGPNEVRFHRKSVELQTVSGQLGFPAAVGKTSTDKATVFLQAADGKSRYATSGTTSSEGKFELRGMGERFAILATTADKKAAGHAFARVEQAKSTTIDLAPTGSFRGRLINQQGEPLVNCNIAMDIRLNDPESEDLGFDRQSRTMTTLTAKTEADGGFEFTGVPVSVALLFRIADVQAPEQGGSYLGTRMLLADDDRPRETFRVGSFAPPESMKTLDQRLANLTLDCTLNDANGLVVVLGKGEQVEDFASSNILGITDTREIFWYLPLVVSHQTTLRAEEKEVLTQREWSIPGENQILIVATDSKGNELEQLNIAVADKSAAEIVAKFLLKNKGLTKDAKLKFDAALAEAKQSKRKVWATIGHTRCAPCIRMARWLESQKKTLDKDFVFVKIDTVRDENAIEIAKRITSNELLGIPFYAIFDSDGSILIDAKGPMGNTGFPAGSYEGQRHLRLMLVESANALTENEIDEVIASLEL